MRVFCAVFQPLPDMEFRVSTAGEPGLMPAEHLEVLRGIKANGLPPDYTPRFD